MKDLGVHPDPSPSCAQERNESGAPSVAFTPGPWSVPHFAEPGVGCECGYVLTGHMMGAVCTVHVSGEGHWAETGDNPKFAEACANANLIAAAPELYEALRECAEALECERCRYEMRFGADAEDVGARSALKAADAALAKAEGRS